MKKTFYLLMALLTLSFSTGLSVSAQTMPKVSDGTNSYWYYMKNHGDTDRAAKVLTKNAAGFYLGIDAWNNKSTWAKFKVVAGTVSGKFDIMTEDGLFLNKGINGDLTAVNVFVATDNTDWTLTADNDSRGIAAYRLFNDDGKRLQLKTPFSLRSEYADANENNNLWSFISVADQGFKVSGETTTYWHSIRNLDLNAPRLNAYLGVNTTDNKLITAQTKGKLWKFVASPTTGKYYIVNENGRYITRTLDATHYTTLDVADETCEFEIYPTFGVNSNKKDFIIANNFELGTSVSVLHPTNHTTLNLINYTGKDQASKWMVTLFSFSTELAGVVTDATNLLTKTAAGNDPGQFLAATRNTLQNAITAANDKITANTVVEADITALQTAIDTYNSLVIRPLVSTEGNEIWYFFQGQRPANSYMTSMGAGAGILSKAVIPNDTQLWKIVANTEGKANGLAFVNKATGEYLGADAAFDTQVFSVPAMPTNNLQIKLSDIFTNKTARFWIEHSAESTPAFRLHAGVEKVMNWDGGKYDNSSWLIMSYSNALKVFLQTGITNAAARLTNTTEGVEFGQFPAAARNALSNAKTDAELVYNTGSASESDIIAATTAINTAISTYNAAIVMLYSTAENPIWIQIQGATVNTGDYHYNKAIFLNADKSFTWKTPAINDNQLFRFERIGTTETFRIVGKLHPDGEMLNTTSPISYGTPVNTAWSIETLTGANGNQYRLLSGGKILHLDGAGTVVSWNAAYNSASAFKIVTESVVVGNVLNTTIITAQNVQAKSLAGTNPGCFTAEAKGVFQTAINNAIAVRDNPASTPSDKTNAIPILVAAQATLAASPTAPIKYSGAATTTWYKIKSVERTAQPYLKDGGIDQGVLSVVGSDDQALWWKIVDMGEGTVNVISKVNAGHIEIPTEQSVTLKLVSAPQLWKTFSVGQAQFCFQSTTGTLRTWHLAGGFNLVAYGVPTVNSGESFYLEEVTDLGTSVDKAALSNINLKVVNRMLVVSGTTAKAQAYTVTGSQVNATKALNPGIYIVKVENQTFKVIVR